MSIIFTKAKKIIAILILLIISLVTLSGCKTKDNDREKIVEQLKQKELLPANVELVDKMEFYKERPGAGVVSTMTYIYKDENDILIGVGFPEKIGEDSAVVIYDNVKRNPEESENLEDFYSNEREYAKKGYYTYGGDKRSLQKPYIVGSGETYTTKKVKDSFWKKHIEVIK